jgi:hypothetical protein
LTPRNGPLRRNEQDMLMSVFASQIKTPAES